MKCKACNEIAGYQEKGVIETDLHLDQGDTSIQPVAYVHVKCSECDEIVLEREWEFEPQDLAKEYDPAQKPQIKAVAKVQQDENGVWFCRVKVVVGIETAEYTFAKKAKLKSFLNVA